MTASEFRLTVPCPPWPRQCSVCGRLEQLDRIAGRILEEDLGPAGAPHDVVSEPQAGGPQALHFGDEVVHDELDPVPAARHRLPAIGHGPTGRARSAAEQEPETFPRDVREGRGLPGEKAEAEVGRVEGDGGVDVVDHVADVDPAHPTLGSDPFQQDGDALADADAHRADGVATASRLELVRRRRREARAAHPERVAERDGAPVRVHVLGVVGQPEIAESGQGLGGERLVQLDHVDPAHFEAGAGQQLPRRRHGTDPHDARRDAGGGPATTRARGVSP